jgi:hypothetical protein
MTTIKHSLIFTLLTTTLAVSIILSQVSYDTTAFPMQYQGRNQTFGVISSIQNDGSGQPAWIVTGPWTTTLLSDISANSSQTTGNLSGPYAASPFNTQLQMVMLDGTAGHTHTVTDFVLANVSQPDNMTKVFNGTSTASMREGPIADIPTTITITGDKVISIWLDPSKIENHYGNTPIYGLVIDEKPRPGPMDSYGPPIRK